VPTDHPAAQPIGPRAPRATPPRSSNVVPDELGGTDKQRSELTSTSDRAQFLAKASRLLAESLDYENILQEVADAAVPVLADWCVVDVVHSDRAERWPPAVRRVAVAGRDDAKAAWARRVGAVVERDWNSPNGLPQVLRSGTSAFFPVVTEELIRRADLSDQEKAIFLRIGLHSAICVPLVARGRTFGAISFAMAESRRRYEAVDLALAENLANHAAIAIDNARLYADERDARVAAERAARRLARLQTITAALSYARTPTQVGEVVIGHAMDAVGANGALVYVASEAGSVLDLVCAAERDDAALEDLRRVPIHSDVPVAEALRARAAVFVSHGPRTEHESTSTWPSSARRTRSPPFSDARQRCSKPSPTAS
jgi:GAF domain-containing protein